MTQNSRLFISFEGPDGSGKSTQARLLAEALRGRGFAVTETREPGGTDVGERIRDILLHPMGPSATPLTMAFLLSASRAQLVNDVILPALGEGRTVISDRFADSTVAYQAFGLGLDVEIVRDLGAIATNGILPDRTIYIDIPVEMGLQRLAERGKPNRLDSETAAFHQRVRDGYRQLIEEDPGRWIFVNGAEPPEVIHREIMQNLAPLLEGAPA